MCKAATVGIDLGTSNSAVAILRDGVPVVVEEAGDRGVVASVVAYTQAGEVLVGQQALAQAEDNPLNTYYSVKRLAGRTNSEVEAMGASSRLAYQLTAAQDGTTMLQCPVKGVGAVVSPEEVSAEILRALLSRAERALGEAVASAVVTVPARFGPAQRAATLRAAHAAGIPQVQLLQEPVAAALAHAELATGGHAASVLVLDLGGGTADVSLVAADEGALECIATSGDEWLGGDDWDAVLVEQLMAAMGPQAAAAVRLDAGAMQRVRTAAEAAKVALSSAKMTEVILPGGSSGGDTRVQLTRSQLEAATAPLRAKLVDMLAALGKDTYLAWAESPEALLQELRPGQAAAGGQQAAREGPVDKYAPPPRRITHAVLVGGATRTPSVRQLVTRLTGAEPLDGPDPEQAVALGAATHAGMLLGLLQGGMEARDGAYLPAMHERVSGFVGVPSRVQ